MINAETISDAALPASVKEAVIDFFDQQLADKDGYWGVFENWTVVKYSPQVETLFLRNTDLDWDREQHYPYETLANDFFRERLKKKKFQLGFFTPKAIKTPPPRDITEIDKDEL